MKWLISDIHGCNGTLQKLISAVFEVDKSATFLVLGDLVDRGRHSKQVIDTLIDLQQKTSLFLLRGNHDDMLIHCLTEGSKAWTTDLSLSMYHYLIPTFASYGFENELGRYAEIRRNFPKEHLDFLLDAKPMYMDENFFACHAWYPNVELPRDAKFLNRNLYEQLIWGRFASAELADEKPWGLPGYFGHTPTCNYRSPRVPCLNKWINLIDTGSFASPDQGGGVITAYCPESKQTIGVDTLGSDLIEYGDVRRRV